MRRLSWLTVVICLFGCLLSLRGAEGPAGPVALAPEEAARAMEVPEGFEVTLFAGEPDVLQPINFCIDDRGRLWVAEAYSYPEHTDEPAGDRIVILEDVTGDGTFDERTVFYEGLNYVTGIEVGFGGVWVMSPPFFYFIPDADGDGVPDGEPRVLLDGFGNHANSHNLANALAWGPDGWLYGTHGRTNWSTPGRPGTDEEERGRLDGGVWRYHPVRHVWESFSDGTTNPFGIDWDDYGQAFTCNSVDPHLYNMIQGGHYEPWRNRESSRFAYERIETIADHRHYVGRHNRQEDFGAAEEDAAGGGHAHAGTMVYLGDNWPDEYRNGVFMNNVHGRRMNHDRLRRTGSGYTASHEPDLMVASDPAFRGTALRYGPEGAVYVSDWSDTNDCHSYQGIDRETGRIYRISYGEPEKREVNVAELSDAELVELQLHRNDWWVRHARRVLHERAAAGEPMAEVHAALHEMYQQQRDVPRQLRAMWALHVTGGVDDAWLIEQLDADDEHVRAWAVRLLCEDKEPPDAALHRFRELAEAGDSPFVRRHIASALRRLPEERRWPIVDALVRRGEDRDDQNLPLMVWYAAEPLVGEDLERFIDLASVSEIPLLRRHVARRVASLGDPAEGLELLAAMLSQIDDETVRGDLLDGMLAGLEGRRSVAMPEAWPETYARLAAGDADAIRERAMRLALTFDDADARHTLRQQAVDEAAEPILRRQAIEALVEHQGDELAPLLLRLLDDAAVRSAALRGLADYEHPETPAAVLDVYPELSEDERRHAVSTLASRPAWAARLLDAIEADRVPRRDLTAYTARQVRRLDDELAARVGRLWGELRETDAERAEQIERYKRSLTPEMLDRADLPAGRLTFQQRCAACHQLFDVGGDIGPDLTGSHRDNLDYMLRNLIDPNATVAGDYQMTLIRTTGGRVITGRVAEQTETTLTVVTAEERIVLPREEVDSRETAAVSMMPEGLLNDLSFEQVRDLIAYLASPTQVPLPDEAAAASDGQE